MNYWSLETDANESEIFKNIIENFDNPEDFFKTLNKDNAESYGFLNYISNIYLIPYYLFDFIPVGTILYGIDNEKVIFNGNNIDDDVRMGVLGYGLKFE